VVDDAHAGRLPGNPLLPAAVPRWPSTGARASRSPMLGAASKPISVPTRTTSGSGYSIRFEAKVGRQGPMRRAADAAWASCSISPSPGRSGRLRTVAANVIRLKGLRVGSIDSPADPLGYTARGGRSVRPGANVEVGRSTWHGCCAGPAPSAMRSPRSMQTRGPWPASTRGLVTSRPASSWCARSTAAGSIRPGAAQ